MPISWSEPSSSEASFDSGWAKADGDFGLPGYCWCGKFMQVVECTTEENRGRRYYKCPATAAKDGFDHSRDHKCKWWDHAVEEEFTRIHVRLQEQQELAFRYGGSANPALESLRESVRHMREEMAKLQDRLAQAEGELSLLSKLCYE